MGYFLQIVVVLTSISFLIVAFEVAKLLRIFYPPEIIEVKEVWWGKSIPSVIDERIIPFQINVSQEVLDDLQYRLDHTRTLPLPLEDTQWYGFNGNLARDILNHWKTKYNWRNREIHLNKYPQFITNIQGLDIHFLHVKPKNINKNVKVIPLLMLHGWPGSVREFYEIIHMLTTPRKDYNFVFEVIAPHLPGFGFSEAASKPGLGATEIALILKNLMNRLGFEKYYLQGGDLGSMILQSLSTHFEDSILGYHCNFCLSVRPISMIKLVIGSLYPSWIVRNDHRDRIYPLMKLTKLAVTEFGYLHIQATKPDTIGIAVDDSPMGLAAYILEKFVTGTDFNFRNRSDGGLKSKWKYDDLLDNIMLYWINKCATTSFRLYAEIFNEKSFVDVLWTPVKVPTACARFKSDVYFPDALLPDTYHNLIRITDYDTGHFPAFETPKVLAEDIFEAINIMQTNAVTRNV